MLTVQHESQTRSLTSLLFACNSDGLRVYTICMWQYSLFVVLYQVVLSVSPCNLLGTSPTDPHEPNEREND